MLRSCRWCGRIHDTGYDCPKKPKKKRVNYDTEAARFRRTQKWTKLSQSVRDRDHYLCQICIRNRYQIHRQLNWEKISVHHIVPLDEDISRGLDDTNLITLCSTHHEMAEDGTIPRKELFEIAKEQNERTVDDAGW